jgi:arylsulfatase A-like enzyme
MMTKPNIVFFFADQQRWDTIGAYGQELDVTPNLDKMASEGVLFTNAFSMQPVCGPARAALQTGTYPTDSGCFKNGIALPQEGKKLADYFNDAGYETGYIGKWHLASNHSPRPGEEAFSHRTTAVPERLRGGYKDHWLAADVLEFTSHGYGGYMFDSDNKPVVWDLNTYRPDFMTDKALEYLDGRDSEDPFFLFISYIEPHHQNDNDRYEGPRGSKKKWKDYVVPGDLVDTEGDWRENYPDYLGCCNSLDYNLGRLRAKLEELGIADDTVIVYTADHGSHFKTRNGEYKRCCHAGCTHIPLIACGPGFNGGKVIDEMVSLMDMPTTLLHAGGIDVGDKMQGRPVQPLVDGSVDNWPDEVFIQISESQVGRCIRTKKWTYSVSAPGLRGGEVGSSDRYQEEFLYDLEKDPHERNNLIADDDYDNVKLELRETLLRRMVEAGEDRPEIT